MANTPNSRKVALETAKDRREQLVDEQALKEIELSNAQTARERKQIQKELNALIKEEASIRARIASYEDKSVAAEKSIADSLQDQISTLKIKKNLSDKLSKSEDLQLRATKIIQSQLERGVITYEQAEDAVKKLNRSIRERLSIEEKTKKVLDASKESAKEFLSDITTQVSQIPLIGGALSKGFNTFLKSPKGSALSKKIANKLFNPNSAAKSSKMMSNAGTGVAVAAAGIAITKKGFELTTKESEIRKDIRRTLGLTNSEANEFRSTSKSMLRDANSMATTQEEILKASSELQDTYGHMADSNTKLMNSQITLTKGFGLQAQEAESLNVLADATGQSYDEQLTSTVAMAQAVGKVSKFGMNVNKIMAEVANLSASIKATLGGSAAAMAKAVIQAKLMGTTLQQMDGAAENLLNIESSIEAQVTAQLVTGKNINLDRARLFALNNDLVGVARELTKQGIDYASFGKMNRVEQQATAAAMGMQKDEFADMLLKQKMYAAVGADINATDQAQIDAAETQIALKAKAGDAEAKKYIADQKALSVQERMTAAVESMAGFFQMLGPIIMGLGVGISILGIALAVAAVSSVTMASALTFGLGAIAIAGAIGAIMGVANGFMQSVSDGEAPASKGPFTITDKFGATAVTQTGDGVVVSPNISRGSAQPNTNTVISNNKETNDLLRQLIAKVDQPAIIKMGDTTINEMGNKTTLNRNYQAEA
jgi:hypothetical protein